MVRLEHYLDPLDYLSNFLRNRDQRNFRKLFWKCPNAFQMASFGAKIIHKGELMPPIKVQEKVYHRIRALQPVLDEDNQCLQMYFVRDITQQSKYTVQGNKDIDIDFSWNDKIIM